MTVNADNLLSPEFLAQYAGKRPDNAGPLFDVVYLRTYCRWIEEKGRRETWAETVERVVKYSMSLYQGPAGMDELVEEAEFMYDSIFNLYVLPAGRTLWVGGTEAARRFAECQLNCAFCVVDRLSVFGDIFHLLLCGAGVGFRVEKDDVAKLPRLRSGISLRHLPYQPVPAADRLQMTQVEKFVNPQWPNRLSVRIRIGDSKEAWVESLRAFLRLLRAGDVDEVEFDYNSIRPQGERIKTFGGRAAGHTGIQEMFQQLNEIVARCNGVFSPVDAMDVCNIIALNVVVGGNRRSSQIALGNFDDTEFVDAKKGLWTDSAKKSVRWRVMSNNSIVCRSKPSHEQFQAIFQNILDNGEPGFFNLEAAQARRPWVQGTNPCFPAGTMVLTKLGHYPIEKLVGKRVPIWDGTEWVTVDNFRVTGKNQEVLAVKLSSGQTVQATGTHTFILEDGSRKQLRDLKVGDRLATHTEEVHGTHHENGAYLKGFLVGDGTSNESNPLLWVYPPKYVCADRLADSANSCSLNERIGTKTLVKATLCDDESYGRKHMQGLSARSTELMPWCTKYKKHLPIKRMLNWDLQSKLEFIAGAMDADGTALDSRNGFSYQICSINHQWLLDFQMLLRSIGVRSHVALSHPENARDWGDRGGICVSQACYRLSIGQTSAVRLSKLVKFERLASFADKELKYVLRNREAIVESIEFSHVADEVYCCTVPNTHSFALSNGLLVGNCGEILTADRGVCNLSTVVLTSFLYEHEGKMTLDMQALMSAVSLATRICLRQTNIEMSLPEWSEVQKRDRLLGVSMTGIMDAYDALGWESGGEEATWLQKTLNELANVVADEYAFEMRVPRPLLVTCLKPEGTLSQLPTVSSGLHRSYAPYYVRRIRVSSIDPVCKAMKAIGVPNEPCQAKADRTVFSFPIKTNAKLAANDESAVDQYLRYVSMQTTWTDHNSSCTLTISKDEVPDVIRLLEQNWDVTVGVALLPKYSGDAYPQMPYEQITEQQYQEMMLTFPDLSNLAEVVNQFEREETVEDDLEQDPSCAGGACPIR